MSKIDKFLLKQLKILHKTLYNSLLIILRKISKIIEMENIKNSYSLDIQILIERKIEKLKIELENRQKRNELWQRRIEILKETIKRMEKGGNKQ